MATKRRNISSSRKHFNKSRKMRGGANAPRYKSFKKIRNIPSTQSTITKRLNGSRKKIINATSPLISRFTEKENQPQGQTPFGRKFLETYSPNLLKTYNLEMKEKIVTSPATTQATVPEKEQVTTQAKNQETIQAIEKAIKSQNNIPRIKSTEIPMKTRSTNVGGPMKVVPGMNGVYQPL